MKSKVNNGNRKRWHRREGNSPKCPPKMPGQIMNPSHAKELTSKAWYNIYLGVKAQP
jgi:hypothetical protein